MNIVSYKQYSKEFKVDLLEIWESAVKATHDFLDESSIYHIKKQVEGAFILMEVFLIAFNVDNKPIAFLGLAEDKIEMLFVHDSARGKGIGKKLILEAIHKLNARFVDVNEQNIQGVGFYKYLGFEVISRSEIDGQGNPYPILHMELKNI